MGQKRKKEQLSRNQNTWVRKIIIVRILKERIQKNRIQSERMTKKESKIQNPKSLHRCWYPTLISQCVAAFIQPRKTKISLPLPSLAKIKPRDESIPSKTILLFSRKKRLAVAFNVCPGFAGACCCRHEPCGLPSHV